MSVHRRRSQIATVKAMTITADSLLPRPKLDRDVGYNVAMKGVSVVVPVQGSSVDIEIWFKVGSP